MPVPSLATGYVDARGALFDGTALRDVAAMMLDVEDALANSGVEFVQYQLAANLKNPTGYYQSQIHVARQNQENIVTDGGVVYGLWLEGVGSRNYPATRFRGYASFRRATQQLNQAAELIATIVVERYVSHWRN